MATAVRLHKKAGFPKATSANSVQSTVDAAFGQQSPEFRLKTLSNQSQSHIAQLNSVLPSLCDELTALERKRTLILEDGAAKMRRSNPNVRLTQADRTFLLQQQPDYFDQIDAALLKSGKVVRQIKRTVRQLRSLLETECTELTKDFARDKVQMLLAMQQESAVSMQFTDIEGLITLPSESRRARRGMQLEEGAVGGKAIPAERRAKLTPKPKAKVRAKKAKPNPGAEPPAPVPMPPPAR